MGTWLLVASHLGRFESTYIAILSHLYFNAIISPLPFLFLPLCKAPSLLGWLCYNQVGTIPWHRVFSSMGSLASRIQPGRPPAHSSSPGPTSASANDAAYRGKAIPVRPALLLVLRAASPFPVPLQRCIYSSGCKHFLLW